MGRPSTIHPAPIPDKEEAPCAVEKQANYSNGPGSSDDGLISGVEHAGSRFTNEQHLKLPLHYWYEGVHCVRPKTAYVTTVNGTGPGGYGKKSNDLSTCRAEFLSREISRDSPHVIKSVAYLYRCILRKPPSLIASGIDQTDSRGNWSPLPTTSGQPCGFSEGSNPVLNRYPDPWL